MAKLKLIRNICLILFSFLYVQTQATIGIQEFCPRIFANIFEGYAPIGNKKAGNYTEYPDAKQLLPCVEACCKLNQDCNVAFVFNKACYHVQCVSNELCLPFRRTSPNITNDLQMVLVNPVTDDIDWEDVLKDDIKLNNNNNNNNDRRENVLQQQLLQPHKQQQQQQQLPATGASDNILNYFDKSDLPENVYGMPYAEKSIESNLNDIYRGLNDLASNQYADSENNDLQMDESKLFEDQFPMCTLDSDNIRCDSFAECVVVLRNSPRGVCKCIQGYARNDRGQCKQLVGSGSSSPSPLIANGGAVAAGSDILSPPAAQSSSSFFNVVPLDYKLNDPDSVSKSNPKLNYNQKLVDSGELSSGSSTSKEILTNTNNNNNQQRLIVEVVSKNVRLPEQEVSLSAFAIPDEKSTNDTYKYSWTLLSQPGGNQNGTMSDQTKDQIKLTNLSEGLYRFKVIVSARNGVQGEAFANITVLPEKRINRPPTVIITPENQTVKLPTTKAILDGSTSTDDDKIVTWHWDLMLGPLGYQPKLNEVSTLELSDLSLPGNYSFKLTLTDSDGAQNSTTACITVLKVTDYPPNANAGADVIVYLPHNNVTLNGSLSTDDHEIVAWEWTKDSTDESKAVDMQNTRTPYLQLSNLEEGMYSFVLKVSDASNQTSSAKVHVFVKPPTNLPPLANAGQNVTINLPQTWSILNASKSSDDIKINLYHWQQLSGPNQAQILNDSSIIANATGLTIGQYEFQLNVIDINKNNGTDTVLVTIVQEKNTPPIAHAGGDQTINQPISAIILNGTQSTDDLGIVRWAWTREGGGLAIGNIIDNSDQTSALILTNIVPGRYVFKLTVWDAQGLSSTDTVSVIVHADQMIQNLIELTITVGASALTQSEFESLKQKIILILGDNTRMIVRDLKINQKTGEVILVFYVERSINGEYLTVPGLEIERTLNEYVRSGNNLLHTMISDVRTSICQNPCSGHGNCNSETRVCMCETFWMPDVFYFWGISDANCEWSILYVVIGVFIGFLCISGCCWGLTCICRRTKKPRIRTKTQKYSLLGTQDDEIPTLTRVNSMSDSDSDSDVLFESRTKPNGILRSNGGVNNNSGLTGVTVNNGSRNGKQKFSVTRLGRRIKT